MPARAWGHVRIGDSAGGNGEHWTGVATRYPADTFELATAIKERFPASRIPENLSVQDRPFRWNDTEPYYTKAEEVLGRLIEGGNVFEGPRPKEYPVPPHGRTYTMNVFEKAAREPRYHAYPLQATTLAHDYTNPDGVSRAGCGYCMLFGCMMAQRRSPPTC